MSSTVYSPLLGFTEPGVGAPSVKNVWGQLLNENFVLIEQGITGDNGYQGGIGGINLTGLSTYKLTATGGAPDQARQFSYPFVGALTGPCTVTLPATVKYGWALNATTGGQNIFLTNGGGIQSIIPPNGYMYFFYSDGNGNVTEPSVAFGNIATGNLYVSGALTLASETGIAFPGNSTVEGDLNVAGSLGVVGNSTVNGASFFGTSGQFVIIPNDGGTQVMQFAPGNYIQFVPGFGFNMVTGGQLVLVGPGAISLDGPTFVNGNGSISGSLGVAGNLGVGGAASIGSVTTNGLSVNGVSTISGELFANGGIASVTTSNLAVGGNAAITGNVNIAGVVALTDVLNASTVNISAGLGVGGLITAFGSSSLSSVGYFLTDSGLNSGAWSMPIGVVTTGSIGMASGGGFFTVCDRRVKTNINDIAAEEGEDWVLRGRPRTFTVDGKACAGFIAQEDIDNGRKDAVCVVPDDGPEFVEGDGYAPPGYRLIRDYNHDIAYLTAALQSALVRIEDLERRLK